MSLGTIYQSIEILSKEKGIDPKIILDAVKDAMLVAARKHFRTTEDLVAEFDERTGAIQIFGVRRVVAEVTDPDKEISLEKARARFIPGRRSKREVRFAKPTEALGPHFRADRQAGDSAEGPRSGARKHLFGIFRPRGRTGHLRHQAHRRSGSDRGSGQDRSSAAEERAIETRKLQRRATASGASSRASKKPARTPA